MVEQRAVNSLVTGSTPVLPATKLKPKGLTLRERLGLLARGEVISRGFKEGYFINEHGCLKKVMPGGLQVGCDPRDLFFYPDKDWIILKLSSSDDSSDTLIRNLTEFNGVITV